MKLWTIGELATQGGVRASALRYYESLGLLAPAKRESGQRRYDASALERLTFIHKLQQAGFKLSEIKTLLNEEEKTHLAWRKMAVQKMREAYAQIEEAEVRIKLLQSGMECECVETQDCQLLN